MKKILFLSIISLAIIKAPQCQELETIAGRISPKELAISPSPAFDLMGASPSQITRTADIKDFKVDWSLRYGINPNFAIQSQPIWEIFFNKRDLSKYQSASNLMRRLASIDLSLGTIQDANSYRRVGGAIKFNVFRQKDPLMEKELYEDIGLKYISEKKNLQQQLKEVKEKLDTIKNILEKPALRVQIKTIEEQLSTLHSRRMAEINERAKIFVGEYWNSSSLDVAFGRMYTFMSDSAATFGMRKNSRSTGWGAWINGNMGIGNKILVSGLFRMFWYQDQVDFLLKDLSTDVETPQTAIGNNSLFSMGLNFRYGGSIHTFFAEILYERKKVNSAKGCLDGAYEVPVNSEVVSSSLNWDVVNPNTVTFGGDWRMYRGGIISYGLRSVFDSNWKFKTFAPIITLSCMMR
ncbi:MAG: hypothetical protein IT214_11715 [Chitinophagaceae bacterium]|jgi:hypothetical protein|nr:hypothetical protein [Chitinophagaceae bacterium]OQY95892.1 MAG: hypothetical protein B6D37_03820 [Sphingobacteriales bacterium UTBCD1]